jgi:hypothetical protein
MNEELLMQTNAADAPPLSQDTSAISLAELRTGVHALEVKIGELAERIETQGAVQLEIARLLQSFHAEQLALPERVSQNFSSAIGELAEDKLMLPKETMAQLDARLGQLVVGMHGLKQTTNMTLRHMGPSTAKIRCAFLVQSIPMWDALADVYWAMTRDARFEPMVLSMNHSHLGRAEFAGEAEVHNGLVEQGIPHLRLNLGSQEAQDILKSIAPDVVFRQQQWDSPVPHGLRTHEINFARICVVPYGTGLLAGTDANGSEDQAYAANYDQHYHRMAWKIFCETELTLAYYRSFDHSDPNKFVLSGYSKLDRLLTARGKGHWPLPEPDGKTFKVVWAPHHSLAINKPGFGVFHSIYGQMLDWARRSPEIQFVLKPHPALAYSAPRSGIISPEAYARFIQEWSSLPNACIVEGQYGELFDASDMLVTDGVSFLTEYHLFEKPIVFIDSGKHPEFNALGKLAKKAAHCVESFKEMKKAVLNYKDGMVWEKEAERQELLRVLRPCAQPASTIILNTIAEEISAAGLRHV